MRNACVAAGDGATNSAVDSTTSNPVMTPPARPTAVVRSPAAVADGGAAIRIVIE